MSWTSWRHNGVPGIHRLYFGDWLVATAILRAVIQIVTWVKNFGSGVEAVGMGKGRPRFGVIDGTDAVDRLEVKRQDVMQLREYVRSTLAGERRFAMRFQSIANVFGPRVVGYEMLARFDVPSFVTPDLVFLEADRIGLGAELEALALARAFQERRRVPRDCFITVNVSPHLLGHPMVRMVLDRDLSGVVIELTEHQPIVDPEALRDSLTWLRARGALVAMDDAGSGYAGLAMLTQIRPDIVKLDRQLVSGIDTDEVKALMCASFGDFVGRINGWLLAEGVETSSELARVVQIGVPLVQGWAIGRPTLAPEPMRADLIQWLRSYGNTRRVHVDSLGALMDPLTVRVKGEPLLASHVVTVNDRAHDTRCNRDDPTVEPLDASSQQATICVVDLKGKICSLALSEEGRSWAVAPSLVVHPEEGIREIAVRALSRPRETRFDPIVCVDNRSRPVGIIRMERIINFLADIFADGGSMTDGSIATDAI